MAFTGPFEDRLAIHELVATYGGAVTRRDSSARHGCRVEGPARPFWRRER